MIRHKWKFNTCQNCGISKIESFDHKTARWRCEYFDIDGKPLSKRPECTETKDGQLTLLDLSEVPTQSFNKSRKPGSLIEYKFNYTDMSGRYHENYSLQAKNFSDLKAKFKNHYWRCTLNQVFLNGKLIHEAGV